MGKERSGLGIYYSTISLTEESIAAYRTPALRPTRPVAFWIGGLVEDEGCGAGPQRAGEGMELRH